MKRFYVPAVVVGSVVVGALAGATGVHLHDKNKNVSVIATPTATPMETLNPTASPTESFSISNVTAKKNGITTEVIGEVKSNLSASHSISLTATFYNGTAILGTAQGVVNSIDAGKSKTFDLLTTQSVDGYTQIKVQVDAVN